MEKKSVCIVTWFGGQNFGTTLQATALCKWFEMKGYETTILGSFRPPIYTVMHPNLLMELISSKLRYIAKKRKQNSCSGGAARTVIDDRIKKYNLENFKVLNITTNKQWKQVLNKKVAFITGSDQIWNPHHYSGKYMLDFATNTPLKKISFSSSIGVSQIPPRYIKKYKKYLGGFDALSVRETSAAELLSNILNREVKVVIDPTQLLDASLWSCYAEKADKSIVGLIKKPYIFCYFVGDRKEYWDYVVKLKQTTDMNVFVIPMHGIDTVPTDFSCIENASAYEFVRCIQDAEIVCTDSFHATSFSITFRKKIYVMKRFQDNDIYSQNSRLYHILGKYGMKDCWVDSDSTVKPLAEINYDKVHDILSHERADAESYLLNSLKE